MTNHKTITARSTKWTFLWLSGAIALSACAQQSEPAEPLRLISEEAEFTALFVDKPFTKDGRTFAINSDGTVGGDLDGQTPVGTWEWKDGTYCRAFTLGSRDFPYACQKVEVSGNTANFTRPDGQTSNGWTLGS